MNDVSGVNILKSTKEVVKEQFDLFLGNLDALSKLQKLSEVSLLLLHDHE